MIGAVARRVGLEQLHVAEQARVCIAAFDQVVAEHAVVGEAAIQGPLEGIHGVDALANEGAAEKQVLIDVRHSLGIGVDTGIAAEQACIGRARHAGQADAHAWLQDRVARADAAGTRVEPCAVQRVLHGADEFLGDAAWQLGVSVQGDDIAHVPELLQVADDAHEALAGAPAQEGIEVSELATLALAAHPAALGRVPLPWPLQQEEALATRDRVFVVQRPYAFAGQVKQGSIFGDCLFTGIHEVAEQREMQVFVTVGQKTNLQPFDQFLDIAGRRQQGRDHHQCAGVGGNPSGVVQPWQEGRLHGQCHQPVHQANGQAAGRQQYRQGHGRRDR